MNMQDINLPADRMILLESMNPEDNILVNVDEIESVKRFDSRPMIYIGGEPQPYGRGLRVTLRSGVGYLVETKMTLREFEIERAKKFTPVAPEQDVSGKTADADWGESDWSVDEVNTEWFYLHPQTRHWVGVADMGAAMREARRVDSRYRAVMYRKLRKEWDAYGD